MDRAPGLAGEPVVVRRRVDAIGVSSASVVETAVSRSDKDIIVGGRESSGNLGRTRSGSAVGLTLGAGPGRAWRRSARRPRGRACR